MKLGSKITPNQSTTKNCSYKFLACAQLLTKVGGVSFKN